MKSAAPSRRDRLRQMLADLHMPGALEALDAILHGVDGATRLVGDVLMAARSEADDDDAHGPGFRAGRHRRARCHAQLRLTTVAVAASNVP